MPGINDLAVRLYRRLFRAQSGARQSAGADAVLDGNSAVALTEACIADSAALGGSFPASGSDLAWHRELQRRTRNEFRTPLTFLDTEGPRGALAAAIGQAMSGLRATAFLSGPDLAGGQDLLTNAAGRHLPLVIHLSNQALPAQGATRGSGHETLHQVAESGCFILFAANVQEAADFTLIARRVAEAALIPGIVAMDGERTALSAQELCLPGPQLVQEYLGPADESITSPTPSQRMLFGEHRRRVPRWHNLDRPLLQGTLQSPRAFALGVAGARPYFDEHLEGLLEEALDGFAKLTGRHYDPLSCHRMDDAELVLLTQGATLETACATADHLRQVYKLKTGVLGLRILRPFPGPELIKALSGRPRVAVLERIDAPLAGDPPLLRELRASLSRALDNGRFGQECHPDYPLLDQQQLPRLHSAVYGVGGFALNAADLIAYCRDMKAGEAPARIYLGIEFHNSSNLHPKRRVLLDQIRRAYPASEHLGLRTRDQTPELKPEGSLSLAVQRLPGRGAEAVAGEAAAMLHRLAGGVIRCLPGLGVDDWAEWTTDRVLHAPGGQIGSCDEAPVDIALIDNISGISMAVPHPDLRTGGTLLIQGTEDDAGLWQSLGNDARAAIKQKSLSLYRLPAPERPTASGIQAGPLEAELADAHRLGALFTVLVDTDLIDQTPRRILSAWKSGLEGLGNNEQDRLHSAFELGMEAAHPVDYEQLEIQAQREESIWSDEAPKVVRQLGSAEETFDSLARFWDQVGILYRKGESSDLTADPFMATGAVPPLSATFRDLHASRDRLPLFTAENCTGCGHCWTVCPDSAIGVVALTPAALIDCGIRLAKADALRPIASKLAARISALGRRGEIEGSDAGQLLLQAWSWLQEKAPMPRERTAAMQEGLDALAAHLGALPLALTEPLFHSGEKARKDAGELLSMVINPDACKACGLCTAACEEEALVAVPQDTENLQLAQRLWRIWDQTPDTPSDTIERVTAEESIDPMAAILMSRYCSQAMAGGDGAEAGSGGKIALRMTLGAAEYQQQPLVYRFTRELGDMREKINDLIRETLTDALPGDDLERLASNLRATDGRQVDLSTLTRDTNATLASGGIDTQRLSRLVELAQGLGDAHWRLSEGAHGLGRARFGLAISPGGVAGWAGAFPNNPFQAPVTLDLTGEAGQLAAGLLQGQLGSAIHTFDLVHRGRAELDPRHDSAHQTLTWESLSDEERQLCPPLILVGDEAELGGRGFAQVAWLLNSGLPIKILVMSELDLGLGRPVTKGNPLAAGTDPRNNLGLMALAQRRAYVAQTSIAEPAHFRHSVREALGFAGPALIRVHAPSPGRHGFAANRTLEQARLAVSSRAFPLFRYHPAGQGVFGSRITLDNNPQPRSSWIEGEHGQPLTPLSWLLTETRFGEHFSLLEEDDPAPVPIHDWLKLDTVAKTGKTPLLTLPGDEQPLRYRVSEEAMARVEDLGHAWRTLQELAGLVTPFTEKVNLEAEERVAAEHQAALADLQKEHDAAMQELRERMQSDTALHIRDRLMGLAGYR